MITSWKQKETRITLKMKLVKTLKLNLLNEERAKFMMKSICNPEKSLICVCMCIFVLASY